MTNVLWSSCLDVRVCMCVGVHPFLIPLCHLLESFHQVSFRCDWCGLGVGAITLTSKV